MRSYELRPARSTAKQPDFMQIPWDSPGEKTSGVRSTLDAWCTQLGVVEPVVIDLVRLAAAAYMADRLTSRPATLSRTLVVHAQLVDPAPWSSQLDEVARLLQWLSGDEWNLTISAEKATRPKQAALAVDHGPRPTAVALFSGGLDSFAGAVLSTDTTMFLSHTDNPTVTAAQAKAWGWLVDRGCTDDYRRVFLTEAARKKENTTRTRALLFYALAAAAASALGIGAVEVPENGFTGLNLALGNDRGGVMSTRSTHPRTLLLISELLAAVGVSITVRNTYSLSTKGELVAAAAAAEPDFVSGIATTLSCAKLDGRVYKGGNPNRGCGLCVACLTRRSSILVAGLDDPTPYLATTLKGAALRKLKENRAIDIDAVRRRVGIEVDEFTLLESGDFPPSYDLTVAAELCRRGFRELEAMVATV